MNTLKRALGVAPLIGALALAPLLGAAPAHAAGDNPRSYTYASSVAVGQQARYFALDERNSALYVPGDDITAKTGSLTRVDTRDFSVAASSIPFSSGIDRIVVDSATNTGFIPRARVGANDNSGRQGTLDVINLGTGAVIKTITGTPTSPGSIAYYPATGTLYMAAGKTITPVSIETGTVGAAITVSSARNSSLSNIVIDAAAKRLWVGDPANGVITAVDLSTNTWLPGTEKPVIDFAFPTDNDFVQLSAIALDPALHHLYVAIDGDFLGDDPNGKLIVVDTETGKFLGSPTELGDTIRGMAVDSRSHEVYVTSSADSALRVLHPDTWQTEVVADFTKLGIVKSYGAGDANLWSVVADPTTGSVFVSHPYNKTPLSTTLSAVSRIAVGGALPTVSTLEPAPGQDGGEPSTPPVENPVFTGPKAPALAAAPAGAVDTTNNVLSWDVSAYALDWQAHPYGAVALDKNNRFTFSGGHGWSDPKTGAAQFGWTDAIEYRPYPGLAPDVFITLANPYLARSADGTAALSFDVAWGETKTNVSTGYKRVTAATFTNLKLDVQADGSIPISGTPVFAGRAYTEPGSSTVTSPNSFPKSFIDFMDPALRGWWMTTSASADGNARKIPNPISGSFTATTTPSSASGPAVDGGETATPTNPSTPPVEPSKPPVEPSKPPVEPSKPPVEPSRPPVDPNVPVTVTGSLTWGVHDTFRSYILGPNAKGSITGTEGANATDAGVLTFPLAPATKAPRDAFAFSGTATYLGHKAGDVWQLRSVLSTPRVEIDGDTAKIYARIAAKSMGGSETPLGAPVLLATANLSGGVLKTDASGAVTITNAPTVLAETGRALFGDTYAAGTAMSPLSLSTTVTPVVTEPSKPPVEPSKPPVEPSKPPVEPSKPPVEPSTPPVEPSKPPVEPSKPPVEPSKPPVEPSTPPVEPSTPPTEPSIPPVEPSTRPSVPVTTDATTVAVGGSVHITAGGFTADERVEIWLHSTPVHLGSAQADANGRIDITVVIPEGVPAGQHTLVLEGRTARGEIPLTVTGAAVTPGAETPATATPGSELSHTGADVAGIVIAGSVFLLLGLGVILRRRREQQA
ncbi:hypothetical protein D9V32_14465 [Mycetocola tolaasinivorans]|uniref:Htaa domain-containing protein n=1 Tax=Mycetocola tolaasinivorans TaxID=76635 RepID=A0A3L6ZZF0_9MICO|nr:HtaA domain-containing protein [Mycetocola tolaasinivorans]RLP73307.1 hypothetical protein D9V32_14465 [Mycetocola tolaasinivorans]